MIEKQYALGFWGDSKFCILTPVIDGTVSTIFVNKRDAERWNDSKYDGRYKIVEVGITTPEPVYDMTISEVEKALGKKIRLKLG